MAIGFLVGMLTGGCSATPMSYTAWKEEQTQRARFSDAGLPYKSPAELRREAADMRRVAQDADFTPAAAREDGR